MSLRIVHSTALAKALGLGDSLAVNGVCLTVVEQAATWSRVELAPETLRRTTLAALRGGSAVNLEPALRVGDAMGGHWVQGHVDITVAVCERSDLVAHRELAFELPAAMASLVVEKGSVTLDGVSLTVASRDLHHALGPRFSVALIPHTLEVTTLSELEVGNRVNLEVDVLAKYVASQLEAWRPVDEKC
jgi:riboflavin synthase